MPIPNSNLVDITGLDLIITLNNAALSEASEEFITATVLHEALHAYFRTSQSVLDHETMVSQYIPWFTDILHSLYPDIPPLELTALAYGGLKETVGFQTGTSPTLLNFYYQANNDYKISRLGKPCHNTTP